MKRKEFEKFATRVRRAVMKALDDKINEIVQEVNQRGEEIRKEAEEWFKEEIKKNPEIILGGDTYAYREGTPLGTIYSRLGLRGAWIGLAYKQWWYSLDKAPVPDELKKKYREYLELDKKLVKELNKLVILRKTVYHDLIAWKKRVLRYKAYKEEPISFPAKYWGFVSEEFQEFLTLTTSSEEGAS